MTVSVAFTRSQVLLACARSIGQLQSTHKATLIFFLLFPLSLGGAAFSSLGFQVSPDLARFLSLYLFPSCSANVLFEAGSTLSESPPRRQQSPEREREREAVRGGQAKAQRRREEKGKETRTKYESDEGANIHASYPWEGHALRKKGIKQSHHHH